ncbi:hypothetical protein B0H13DRAFT_2317488 [Mycena leptocephala]|nr:hypothetical protein B0H13DRAFT_2317488 [Mycena leptocephala]
MNTSRRSKCLRGEGRMRLRAALRARRSYGGTPPVYGALMDATSARDTFVWTRAHTRVRFQDADMYQSERGCIGADPIEKGSGASLPFCPSLLPARADTHSQSFQFRYILVIR